MRSAFIIPTNGQLAVARLLGDALEPVVNLGVPWGSIAKLRDDGVVATISEAHKRIRVHRCNQEGIVPVVPPFNLPRFFQGDDLVVVGNVLYVCGRGRRGNPGIDMLGMCVLDRAQPRWLDVPVPAWAASRGKRIDALFVDGSRLLAVDNVIRPKWILIYDITEPSRPVFTDAVPLVSHATYERVRCAAMGTNWVALLASAVGQWGAASILALLDRSTLQEHCAIIVAWGKECHFGSYNDQDRSPGGRSSASHHPDARMEVIQVGDGHSASNSKSPEAAVESWQGLAFSDDTLLIAAGEKGVGVLDLSSFRLSATASSMFTRIRYVQPTGAYWPVVTVVPVPGLAACVAVEQSDGGETAVAITRW